MQVKKNPSWFLKTLGIKLLSLLLFLLFGFLIQPFFMPGIRSWSLGGLAMGMISLFIGNALVYLIWLILFALIRFVLLRQKATTFYIIFSLTLVLNFLELFFLSGNLGRFLQISEYYGLFHANTWATLPDFPETLSMLIATVVFTIMYFSFVEKKSETT